MGPVCGTQASAFLTSNPNDPVADNSSENSQYADNSVQHTSIYRGDIKTFNN